MTHDVRFNIETGIQPMKRPVDNITIEAFDSWLNISQLIYVFAEYMSAVEKVLTQVAEELKNKGTARLLIDLPEAQQRPLYLTVRATKIKREKG